MASFTSQTGNLAYRMAFVPATTSGEISFGLEQGRDETDSLEDPILREGVSGSENMSYSLDTTYQYTVVGNPESGSVGIYYHLESPNAWYLEETVTGYYYSGSNPKFGTSVAIEEETVAVGLPYATVGGIEERGAVAVFFRSQTGGLGGATGSRWGQAALITGDATIGSRFGTSIDISAGGLFAAGAPGENAAYVFTNDSFDRRQKIEKPSSITGSGFGGSLSLLTGESLNSLAVGTYENGSGAVAIFQQIAGYQWGRGYNSQIIRSPVAESGDLFGSALASAGNTLLVGSPHTDVASQSGRAYVYNYDSYLNTWKFVQELSPSNLGATDKFGKNVAIDGGNLIVGSNASSGSAYIFQYDTSWTEAAQISGSGVATSGSFGGNGTGSRNIGIWEGDVLVGTTNEDHFYYFTTGLSTDVAIPRLSFSGVSGKLFDNEGNYINSYLSGQTLEISGNVFTGYHNYFVNNVLTHSACSYETGIIDSYYVSGTGLLSSFYIRVNA